MDPRDVHVRSRIEELHRGAAQRRLSREANPDPLRAVGEAEAAILSRRSHALAVAVGTYFIRIGVALGARPLGEHRP